MASCDSPRTPRTPTTPVRSGSPALRGPRARRCREDACEGCPFPVGAAKLSGRKGEDAVAVDCRDGVALLAVFDGHRSSDVAVHAAETLPGLVWSSAAWPTVPGEALQEALRRCHESARHNELKGGSTVVVLACVLDDLWCCNAGDSRAVAGLRGGGARRLSVDHKASAPEEMERIMAIGGSVSCGRLGGMLEVSRGIGDCDFESHGFTSEGHVASVSRAEVDFVVLASDGLWDVVEDGACCDLVRDWDPIPGGGSGGHGIAARLAEHARELGSDDDISVIVAHFPRGHEQ